MKSKVDIYCLQEVLFSDVQREIVAAVIDKYPYAFSAQNLSIPTPSPNTMACGVGDLQNLLGCVIQGCVTFQGPLPVCITQKYSDYSTLFILHIYIYIWL